MPLDGTDTIRTSPLVGLAAPSAGATAAPIRNSRLVEQNKDLSLPMAPFSLKRCAAGGHARVKLGMGSGWIRVFVLVAAAALLANVQCYATCWSDAYNSPQTPPANSCHHQKSSHEDTAPCSHQHSDFAAPGVGSGKVSVAAVTLILPTLQADSGPVVIDPPFMSQLNADSPPGSGHFRPTVSVLRI
jgi:hypothetical protein